MDLFYWYNSRKSIRNEGHKWVVVVVGVLLSNWFGYRNVYVVFLSFRTGCDLDFGLMA